jgi:CRP-like cAMP-binding protein
MNTAEPGEATLAGTRAELRDLLRNEPAASGDDHFPRSATMRALTGGGAASVLVLAGLAILATRPGIAGRFARAAPVLNLLRQLGARGS